MREPPIVAIGTITAIREIHLYDATLPNGKPVIAHVPRWAQTKLGPLNCGTKVTLELTPFDFSTARIAGVVEA
jgi:translation initiation factor IF-1